MSKSVATFVWEAFKVFAVSMVIIIPIRYFLVQPFLVRGPSMEPNFFDGEYLVIDKLSYRLREPSRGEVVVFRLPLPPSHYLIKRIVGLPGETVTVADGKVVIANDAYPAGRVLDESTYLSSDLASEGNVTLTLAEDQYFVLGDNRAASLDSRSWGALARGDIAGRAWIRAFPFWAITVFSSAW